MINTLSFSCNCLQFAPVSAICLSSITETNAQDYFAFPWFRTVTKSGVWRKYITTLLKKETTLVIELIIFSSSETVAVMRRWRI